MDIMYTTCEAGKMRSVNHTRALARLTEAGVGAARRAVRVRVRGEQAVNEIPVL